MNNRKLSQHHHRRTRSLVFLSLVLIAHMKKKSEPFWYLIFVFVMLETFLKPKKDLILKIPIQHVGTFLERIKYQISEEFLMDLNLTWTRGLLDIPRSPFYHQLFTTYIDSKLAYHECDSSKYNLIISSNENQIQQPCAVAHGSKKSFTWLVH